mgnify:CR=1 FL=1
MVRLLERQLPAGRPLDIRKVDKNSLRRFRAEVNLILGILGDPLEALMDCKDCKTRHRADKLIELSGHTNNLQNQLEWA